MMGKINEIGKSVDWKKYDSWLNELVSKAADEQIDLKLGSYSYHTYFSREWSADDVLEDLRAWRR